MLLSMIMQRVFGFIDGVVFLNVRLCQIDCLTFCVFFLFVLVPFGFVCPTHGSTFGFVLFPLHNFGRLASVDI